MTGFQNVVCILTFALIVFLHQTGFSRALPSAPSRLDERIIGGEEAVPHSVPYLAALQTPQGQVFCGGSLISEEWVLTAANCVENFNRAGWTVTLGAHDLTQTEATQVRSARRVIKHPGWNSATSQNDLALVQLSSPVELNDNVATIRLPPKSMSGDTFAGTSVTLSGWGRTSGANTPSVALSATSTIMPNTLCSLMLSGSIQSEHICVVSTSVSTCNGDSAGPLTLDINGRPIAAGIASGFGSGVCNPTSPSVFTRTTSYLSWISENTDITITD